MQTQNPRLVPTAVTAELGRQWQALGFEQRKVFIEMQARQRAAYETAMRTYAASCALPALPVAAALPALPAVSLATAMPVKSPPKKAKKG